MLRRTWVLGYQVACWVQFCDERRARPVCHFQVIPIHSPFEAGFRPCLNSSNPLHHRLRRTSCPFSSTSCRHPPGDNRLVPPLSGARSPSASFHMVNPFNFSWPRPVRSRAFSSAATQAGRSLAVLRRPTFETGTDDAPRGRDCERLRHPISGCSSKFPRPHGVPGIGQEVAAVPCRHRPAVMEPGVGTRLLRDRAG